jgi:uncharacterized membrane protein
MQTATILENQVLQKNRIASIDIVRGLVMIIMALDHTRDFFHSEALLFDPTDLTRTTPALFFTRWITHFCAPVFVFLSGTSAFLTGERRTKKDLSIFLLTRGLWLMLLEITIVRFGIWFNLYYDMSIFQVIWVLGSSMVVLSAVIQLPFKWILSLGLLLTLGHNLLDQISIPQTNAFYIPWTIIYGTGVFQYLEGHFVFVNYPLIPWLGLMILGYCFGKLYSRDFPSEERSRILLYTGISLIMGFIILRYFDFYGDPHKWSVQNSAGFTIISFLNVTKYPMSLLYTMMTLGPAILLLRLMEGKEIQFLNPVKVFGRVPLFYYILHFYLIHFAALIVMMQKNKLSFSDLSFAASNTTLGGIIAGKGYSLPWVYVAWILVVLTLYPLCNAYNKYKSTHKQWWLSYL